MLRNTVRIFWTHRGSLAGFKSCNLQLVQGLGHHTSTRRMHRSCLLGRHLACVRGGPVHGELLVRAKTIAAQSVHGKCLPAEVRLELMCREKQPLPRRECGARREASQVGALLHRGNGPVGCRGRWLRRGRLLTQSHVLTLGRWGHCDICGGAREGVLGNLGLLEFALLLQQLLLLLLRFRGWWLPNLRRR